MTTAFIRSALKKNMPATHNLQEHLAGLTKNVKARWGLALGAGAALIAVVATTMSSSGPAPTPAPAKDTTVDTTPANIGSQSDWKIKQGADLARVQKNLDEQAAVNKEIMAQLKSLKQDLSTQKTSPPIPGAPVRGGNAAAIDFMIPPPPEAPSSIKQSLIPSAPPIPVAPSGAMAMVPPISPSSPGLKPKTTEQSAGAGSASTPVTRSAARAFIPVNAADSEDVAQQHQVELEPNDKQGFLPAGSFANATLISGVEAFTGGTAQSQPQPLIIRIDHNAFLPNSASFQIKGCHVLASVWGDMSSERVYGRLATLTCVDQNNRLVLSDEVEGNLVDSDGKNGIRGVLQDRQGAKLARSLLAGFASGMATAFGTAQTTTAATVLGTTTSLSGEAAVRAAGLGGVNEATKKLAEFYMKQAEATMPIIAVDAGRKITVLFTRSKALKFDSTEPYKVKVATNLKVMRSAGE